MASLRAVTYGVSRVVLRVVGLRGSAGCDNYQYFVDPVCVLRTWYDLIFKQLIMDSQRLDGDRNNEFCFDTLPYRIL